MNKLYIGIDIHKQEQKVAFLSQILLDQSNNWKKIKPMIIGNNIFDYRLLDKTIKEKAKHIKEVKIAVDHTGGYYSAPIVNYLTSQGYSIVYLESRSVKAAKERFFGEENKTDKIDSAVIAYLLYLQDSHKLSMHVPETIADLESQANLLRSLVLQRLQYIKLANQITNRLHQYLLAVFPECESKYFKELLRIAPFYATPQDILRSNGLKKIEGISEEKRNAILTLAMNTVGIPGVMYRSIIKDLCNQRTEALKKCASLEKMLEKEVRKHPYAETLFSFPYIKEIISATLIGIIRDINYWPDKRKLKKALGVYGREYISGANQPVKRIGRSGNRHGKRVIFQACFGCIRRNAPPNDFRDYYEKQRGHKKIFMKAMLSTMGKMVEIIYHCLKNCEPYQYQGKYKMR